MKGTVHIAAALLALTGCYASTGEAPLDPSLQLADLSDDEYREMCDWHAESEGYPDVPPRSCDGRFTRSPFTPGECIMARLRRSESPECNATVADWVQCRRAVGDDLCMIRHPACLWEGCPPSVP
ncbi:MAG: hypothetical protein EVA89_30410 [Sandaracinaceae bacterium]|nr:MAG: hypothetical protein EVA89_30410 [Sandaracinaceae bacterium]